jgi:hypothetical protein
MKVSSMITIIVVVLLGVFGFVMAGKYISYNNQETELRNLSEAQLKKIESTHNQMRRTLSQIAEVAKLSMDKQQEIYVGLMEGRYSKGDGSLMKMITESNPSVDMNILNKLVNSIEVENKNFSNEQERMFSIINEHKNLITKFPGSIFCKNTTEIKYTVISSTYTKQVMETGKDDDIKLFD